VVVRCRSCDGLLMVITQVHGVFCVDALGLVELQASGQAPEGRQVGA
jgi:hypothetical protein